MASKRSRGNLPEMIHCEYCGEDYSSTYKHCPFCDEMDPEADDYDEDAPARGGKRLVTNTRGGGYGAPPSPLKIIGIIISLALIVAAVIIVISIIKPLVSRGNVTGPSDSAPPVESVSPAPESDAPTDETAPADTEMPEDTIPADQTATSFTLDKTEFSFSDRWPDPITLSVTFVPAGSTGTISWSSSDPDVAAVDENGTVSHGTKKGSATITATMPGGVSQTCLVYNSVTSSSSSSGSSGSSSLSLSRSDFTLSSGQSYQVKVSGTSSTPTWSIGNTAVATVSGDGTVKYVGKGQTTLTCTVDGQTLKCIVRCN